jgi:hypothetical protein
VNLRAFARNQPCDVRLPCCVDGPGHETTVAAHLRIYGSAGMGQKPPDTLSVHACRACHDAIDGRVPIDIEDRAEVLLRALVRTTVRRHRAGKCR